MHKTQAEKLKIITYLKKCVISILFDFQSNTKTIIVINVCTVNLEYLLELSRYSVVIFMSASFFVITVLWSMSVKWLILLKLLPYS